MNSFLGSASCTAKRRFDCLFQKTLDKIFKYYVRHLYFSGENNCFIPGYKITMSILFNEMQLK